MSDRPTCAGARQCVDRVEHPTRGLGWAIYENGEPLFVSDAGEQTPMLITLGGASVTEGSWLSARDPDRGSVRLKQLSHSARHRRRWHSIFGSGWLVSEPFVAAERFARERFEGDDGRVVRFEWTVIEVGNPEYKRKNAGKSKYVAPTEEESAWTTYTLKSGELLAFRKSEPMDSPPAIPPQGDLFGAMR